MFLLKHDDEKLTQTTVNILNMKSQDSEIPNFPGQRNFIDVEHGQWFYTFDNRSIHKPILVE